MSSAYRHDGSTRCSLQTPVEFCIGRYKVANDNKWQQYEIADKLIALLADVTYYQPDHHFGRPFLTAYQLAIAFKERHPDVAKAIGHPLGGAGVGVKFSLTSYLAGQLSQRIRSGEITQIEGAFLSNNQLERITFRHTEGSIDSSMTGGDIDLSMYRYRSI